MARRAGNRQGRRPACALRMKAAIRKVRHPGEVAASTELVATARLATTAHVIPGMNAIAFTREVRALASLEGCCSAQCVQPSFEARRRRRAPQDDGCADFCPTGKSPSHAESCPALRAKIFRFVFDPNQLRIRCRPTRQEGRCARHETRGGMRWTRSLRTTIASVRGRQSRVVLTPQWLVSSS